MGITQCAFAKLAVRDLEAAVGFHVDVIGMVEVGRDNGTVSLGCGVDERCDLLLVEGGTGVRLLALEVESEDDLQRYEGRLAKLGVRTELRSDPRFSVAQALRFSSPSGLTVELVLAPSGRAYLNPSEAAGRSGIAPLDFDHITLKVPDPLVMVDFLRRALEFSVSDELRPAPDVLLGAWTRVGSQHHDVAMFRGPDTQSLHHYALRLESFDHLKQAADRLAGAGISVEAGPGRHSVGGNLYLFFLAPDGNRYEFSAEMPRVGGGGTRVWVDLPAAFSAWGAQPPASFADGS